jgi:hypothetical protein
MNTAKRTLVSAAIAAAIICCCSLHANAMDGAPEEDQGAVNVAHRAWACSSAHHRHSEHFAARGQRRADGKRYRSPPDSTLMMTAATECRGRPFTCYYGNGRVRPVPAMGIKTALATLRRPWDHLACLYRVDLGQHSSARTDSVASTQR